MRSIFQSKYQVGDLMIMLKPQTSVWGNLRENSVASERRFVVKVFSKHYTQ